MRISRVSLAEGCIRQSIFNTITLPTPTVTMTSTVNCPFLEMRMDRWITPRPTRTTPCTRQRGGRFRGARLAGTAGEEGADHSLETIHEEDPIPEEGRAPEVDLRGRPDGAFCPMTATRRYVKCVLTRPPMMKAHSLAKAAGKAIEMEIQNCPMVSA